MKLNDLQLRRALSAALFVLLLSVVGKVFAEEEIVVGDGGMATNNYLPSYSYYKYSLTEQIYTVEEIGGSGYISRIAFYNDGEEKTRDYDIYMVNTIKESFESKTDWIAVTEDDLVYSGTVTMFSGGWTWIEFDTPFLKGESNIALVIDDNTGSYTSSPHMACRVFTAESQALYSYDDSNNYNPLSPPASSSSNNAVLSMKNQIKLGYESTTATTYSIAASASPAVGGTITGIGNYEYYTQCTLTAISNEGYVFVKWTDNAGNFISKETAHRFIVTSDSTFVAHFAEESSVCDITFDLNDSYGDGWNGNSLVVNFNDGSPQILNLTITSGTSASYTLPIVNGSHVGLSWISGSYIGECSFTVRYSNGNGIYHGSNLTNSFEYGFDVDCDGTPATAFDITAMANMSEWGTVSGAGTYNQGQTCTLNAIANFGYNFINWTKNGEVVSTETIYNFTVTEAGNYIANFEQDNEMVFIGCGGTATNEYLPSYSLYNYTLSQQIYTADEITIDGLIDKVSFYNDGATKTRDYDIYMVSTNKTSFENANDWITVTAEDLVYSGSVTIEAGTWTTIVLDIPFDYNTSTNLALIIDDNSGSWTNSPNMACRVYDANGSQAIRIYSDNTDYNPFNPASYNGTLHTVKNQIVLKFLNPEIPWNPVSQVVAEYYPDTNNLNSQYVKLQWNFIGDTIPHHFRVFRTRCESNASTVTLADEVVDTCFIDSTWNQLVGGMYKYGVSCVYEDETGIIGATIPVWSNCIEKPTKDACSIVFNLYDSYGDGWNGNYLVVENAGGLQEQLTITSGSQATYVIEIEDESHVSLSWISGSWTNECSFSVSYEEGEVIYQTDTPSSGLLYEFDCDCFDVNTFYIASTANPIESGTVTGFGRYEGGESCTLTATPNGEFIFKNWTLNDSIVSTNATYSFIVTESGNYVAHFTRLLPELHVIGISHSAFTGGQQVTVSWTVQNDGTAPTPNGAIWYDNVWLSVENRIAYGDNNPIKLGTFENISALGVGESYTQTQTFNIPIDISGEYYLFVITDAYDCYEIYWKNGEMQLPYTPPPYICFLSNHYTYGNKVYELSEYEHGNAPGGKYSDNFFYELVNIAVPLVPDLQVTNIVAPEVFFSGMNVSVTATISNLGEVATLESSWTDALYYAMEPDFNSATCIATMSHSGVLQVGGSYQVTLTGVIPSTLFGEAYFFVQTDRYNEVYEHVLNQNNTTMSEAVSIILLPPADLEPSELVVPVTVSTAENLAFSYKVTNVGAGNPNMSSWKDKVYLCQNADTLDVTAILLKTISHYGGLQPTESYIISESVSLPLSVNSGFYYLYVITDANDDVFEYQYESNNIAQSSLISVTSPDLQITEVSAPEQIISGYPINLSYTIVNYGDGAITNRNIIDIVYVSATASLNGAIPIANMWRNVNLQVGQSATFTCNEVAPSDLTDGTYYLIVVTDANNEIHESNEDNNTSSQYPMPVMHQPLPDLQPVSLTLPDVIQAGGAVLVEFDIANNGDLDLLNSNCTFNIFAVWNDQEVLCPVQSQILPLGSNVSINIGQTVHFVRSILVPASVPSMCTTFKLYVDKENSLTESNENNNTITANATVLDCPLPDLTVSNFTLPTIQAGTEAQVSFTVSNTGEVDFDGDFGTSIYAIANGNQILCPLRQQISPFINENYILPVGGSLTFTQKVLVPPMVTVSCNTFMVMVDGNNTVLESDEDNNSVNSNTTVQNYPFNLASQTFTIASTVTAGETTSVSWTVKNNGTCPSGQVPFYIKNDDGYMLVEGEYLPSPWKDRIYLSDDAVLSDNDIQLLSVDHNTVLNPNDTYSVEQTVILPYSAVGSRYLLCISDTEQMTFDNNRIDNVVAVPVTVELGVLPDLRITSITVTKDMISDQACWVRYTIVNEGERVTQKENWTDAFFIGETMTYIGAIQLGAKIHHGVLEVGETCTDSIEIVVPNGLEGDCFLIGFTDKTNQIYENDNEENNTLAVPVTISPPDPCDLIALQPEFPAAVVSGQEMIVTWQLCNIGMNPAVGRIRNAVYLSTNATWSNDDVMLGYASTDINLASNVQQTFSLSGMLTNVPEGNYYVIVKVNILNALNESSYENNICISVSTTQVSYPTLTIGEEVNRSLAADQYIYYKLQVSPEYEGQTLSCTLATQEQQVANGLYLSHEAVPTLAQYDYGQYAPYAQEIEVLIPALEQGDYYLLVKGSTQNGSPQQVSIATATINFEILHVDVDHGTNTGSVTTKVTGAKFDSIMDFRLVQGNDYLPAEKLFFSNSTETFTTFNLTEMPLGTYAMEAELPGGIITIKGDAFTIEEGLPAELAVNIVAPSSVRRGNVFPVNIEYGNIGTTDLNVSGFVVVSRNGHPIGLTSDELADENTEITFSTAEDNGNPDVLRPGYRNTKTILINANSLSDVKLQVFAVRKQY